jgi:hypothetical protein
MKSPPADNDLVSLDHQSSRAICDAVGERLQLVLHPEATGPSSHLQRLVDELRKRDDDRKSN